MAKERNRGSIKERRAGVFMVQLYCGTDPETGKRIYKNKTVRGTRKDAEKTLTTLLAEKDVKGGNAVAVKMTTEELVGAWMEFKREEIKNGDFSEQSWERYNEGVQKHIIPKLGDYPVVNITAGTIEDQLNAWRSDFSISYVRTLRSILRQSFHFAKRRGYIPDNPADGIRLKKPKKASGPRPSKKDGSKQAAQQDSKTMDPDQVKKFLEAAKATVHYTFFALMLETGIRVGECSALRWEDVEEGYIEINATRQKIAGKWMMVSPKSHTSIRKVPIGKPMQQVLWMHRRNEAVRKASTATWEDEELVFHTVKGFAYNRNQAGNAIRKLFKACDLEQFSTSTHILRHTHATICLDRNPGSLLAVSQRLGHANPQVTLQIYAHALPDSQKVLVETMDDLLFGLQVA